MPRTWLKMVVLAACCMLLAGVANAALTLEQKIELTKIGHTQAYTPSGYVSASAAPETEPNDSCAAPDPGDPFAGIEASISPAGEEDWFTLQGTAGTCLTIGTDALNGSFTDTQLLLYADDGSCVGPGVELAFDDDGGPGLFSLLEEFELPATGTYYVRIRHFSVNGTGDYQLFASTGVCPGPLPGDMCDGALPADCNSIVQGTTSGAANDLDDEPEEFCLDFGGSGPDVFYEVCVPIDNQIDVLMTPLSSWDPAVWLVTDCNDRLTCLAGTDAGVLGDAELVTWVNDTGAEACIFIVADSWTASASGDFTLEITCDQVVATQESSWGAVKAQFND